MTTSSPEATVNPWSPPNLGETETVTVASIRSTLESARQKGYDEGFERGHAEGVAKAQAITADIEQLLTAMVEPFAKQEETLFREQCLVISRIATAVIERELQLEPATIEQALSSALEVVKNEPQLLEIEINASDLERLETVAPDLLQGKSWQVETDHDLMPGGCRIKVGDSIIDASIEARLQAAIREALGLELPEREAPEAS